MRAELKSCTKRELLRRAKTEAAQLGIEGPDRTASRYRDALICWFCQHCPALARPLNTALTCFWDDPTYDSSVDFLDE
jgi:hypothetical protein